MSLADLFLGGGVYFRWVVYVRYFLYLCKLIVGSWLLAVRGG